MRRGGYFALAVVVGSLSIAASHVTADDSAANSSAPGLLALPDVRSNWPQGCAYPTLDSAAYASIAPSIIGYGRPVAYNQPAPAAPPMATPPMGGSPGPTANDVYNGLQTPSDCADCNSGGGDWGFGGGRHGFWYGYAGGIIMTRNEPNKVWLTYDQSSNFATNLNTEMANVHWDGGVEFTFGYRCCCDGGIEVTYWGITNMAGSASVTSATNNLGTPIDVTNGAGGLLLGGQTPDSFFTNAHQAFIWRNDEVHNVEVNLTYNPWGWDNCGWNATWLAGIRCFNFNENLLWTSVAGGFTFGSGGGVNQANLNIKCENDMVGFQIGGIFDYRFGDHLSMFFTPKIGIYSNYTEARSQYYRGDGIVGFDIRGTKDTCSFLGELDLGLNYDIGCHWSFTGGYRVVAVSGVALSDNQIPHFLAASDEFSDVKVNGDLILHGVFLGASFHY